MHSLSVVILTLNEEATVADAIDSVDWADEVVVVDAGSSDGTEKVVKQKKCATFILHKFNHFASQRNFAATIVKSDFVLYLDADEQVDSHLRQAVLSELHNPSCQAYTIKRQNYYLGKKWPKEETILRLFHKKSLIGWYGEVHESAKIKGSAGQLSGYVIHQTHRGLDAMLAKTIVWSEVEARLRFVHKHPPVTWWRIIRVMLTGFTEYYINQKGYLVGTVGLIESIYQSYSMFITYARLWEMQNRVNR